MPQTQVRVFRDAQGRIPLKEWLDALEIEEPKAHAKCLKFVLLLSQMGSELRRPQADSLRDGIHELRASRRGVHYRLLYFFSGRNIAILSHGIAKEDVVPDKEIDAAIRRMKLVARDPDKYTADWPT